MARVKGGNVARKRRKKILKMAKGYFGSKHALYKTAHEQVMKSLSYAYRDRKNTKRNFRKLWITRINAACRPNGISYSKFINGLNRAGIEINRKMLSEVAIADPAAFTQLVELAKKGLTSPKVEKVVEVKEVKKPTPKKVVKKEEVKEEVKPEPKKVETKKPASPEKEEKVDLNTLKVAELKELAKEANIEGYTSMKKAELVEALSAPKKAAPKKEEAKKEVKKEEPKKVAPKKEEKVDLSSMSVADLKALAKDRGLTGYSALKKAELIELLK